MGQSRTILVCDDEATIRHLVGSRLRGAGFDVIEARQGLEGFGCCDPSALPAGVQPLRSPAIVPSLVVTDLQMPVMLGLELAVRLKAFAPTAGVPVIMLTARGYILRPKDLARTNIKALIAKPFGGQALLDKVRELLGDPSGARLAA